MGDGNIDYRRAKHEVSKIDDSFFFSNITRKLNALNELGCINYDDQVLFSKAANIVCDYIYNNSNYDWNYIINSNEYVMKTTKEILDINKRNNRIKRFLSDKYPVSKHEELIDKILNHL